MFTQAPRRLFSDSPLHWKQVMKRHKYMYKIGRYFFLAVCMVLLSACGQGILENADEANASNKASNEVNAVATEFKLGGQVIGLSGTLRLSNGEQEIELNANSSFIFDGDVTTGDIFQISIKDKPQNQTCQLLNDTGTVASGNVTSVVVVCSNKKEVLTAPAPLSIKVSATGLAGSVTVSTADGATLEILQDGASEFQLQSTAALELLPLSITAKPASQNCEILNLSAIDAATTEVSFAINCNNIPDPGPTFAVHLQVSALQSTRLIRLNNIETLSVEKPGRYTFDTRLDSQENYVAVLLIDQQDPVQTCILINEDGQVTDTDILISLQCGPQFGTQLNAKTLPWDGQVQVSWNDVGADQYVLHHAANRNLNIDDVEGTGGLSINNALSPTAITNLSNNALHFFIVEAVFPGFGSLTSKVTARPNNIALDGEVAALAVADNGRVYVGGDFQNYSMYMGGFFGLRIDANKPEDYGPVVSSDVDDGVVYTVVKDDQGGYFIAGDFNSIDGVPRQSLARLHADGALDLQWDPGSFDGPVDALAYDQGILYAGGSFTQINGIEWNYFAAFDANAQLLTRVIPEIPGRITDFAHNGDELYIAGHSNSLESYYLAKISLNPPDDTPALEWTSTIFGNFIQDIVYANNFVYVAGGYGFNSPLAQNLNAFGAETGDHQANFAPNIGWTGNNSAPGIIYDLASDGSNLYVAGSFNIINQQVRYNFAAFGPDNTLLPWAPSIGWTPASSGINAPGGGFNFLEVSNSGNIYVGGSFGFAGDEERFALAALDNNGNVLSWNPNLASIGNATASVFKTTLIDDVLFITGTGGSDFGLMKQPLKHLAAFERDGTLTDWKPPITLGYFNKPVNTLSIDNDIIYVGGQFTEIGGKQRTHLAATSQTGEVIDSFAPNIFGLENFASVNSIAMHEGELYVAGNFEAINDVPRFTRAAIDLNGMLTDWNPSEQESSTYKHFAVGFYSQGSYNRLFVSGTFSKVDEQERNKLAAFNANGALDLGFIAKLPTTTDSVGAIATAKADFIYVAYIDSANPERFTWIAELDNTGDLTWKMQTSQGSVQQLVVDPYTVYAVGYFKSVADINRSGSVAISRSNPPEVLGWDPKLTPRYQTMGVNAVAADTDVIYLGGEFVTNNGSKNINLTAVDKQEGKALKWPNFPAPWQP